MQPTTPAPPVPAGAAALDAWRELPRDVRRGLMRGGRPHPDPAVAVVAVGYARAMLARPYPRHLLWPIVLLLLWAVGAAVVLAIAAPGLSSGGTASMLVAAPVPVPLVAYIYWLRGRFLAWHRLESVHAAALWVSERRDPPPPPAAPASNEEVAVRYDLSALRRQSVLCLGVVALAAAVLSVAWGPVPGLTVAALVLVLFSAALALAVRRSKVALPVLYLRRDGVEVPSLEVRVAWAELTELRVVPFRALGGRPLTGGKGRGQVVVFVPADPEAVIARTGPRWTRRVRRAYQAYGGPLAFADIGMDRPAEEVAAAAAALSGLPVRRFGPDKY
ncbi:hypothetical protein [Spirillospora sp. NPDC029432]|uniref:hypothetical protein n=1 Tax=Spirillospora sp. NPDC029432 TaxID=3154599 RepID=UPI003456A834